MDDTTDQGQELDRGHGSRRGGAPLRPHRSGEGMASVIEHLRRQLGERRAAWDRDDVGPADDTRPPPG
ncbi:hypothetical protein [Ramlibacter algicola]|uniref:Uncharacterized protein n=1 Tax=Ramlibacter algicola TaxID=2795217 RepID=A0A934URH3_9BURK|nr:hypothetical protein [Ramlibacter algicola]MBK0393190.1 hypothetical protein [Ramlibacter algicola]